MPKKLLRLMPLACLRVSIPTLFFLISATLNVQAKNYYFSSIGGNDSYTSTQAQNMATPWKSITKLNSIFSTLAAGDSVLFKRGEVFYGAIIINRSGSSGKPIVFSAYGAGSKPLISGFTSFTSWAAAGNGIYQVAAPGAKSTLNMVTLNSLPMAMGRYPNADAPEDGYLKYESFIDTSAIIDSELTSTVNWTGAEAVVRKNLWVLDRCKILNHSGNTISYSDPGGSDYAGTADAGYFIQNDPRTLDRLGEWYFNNSTRYLQMYFGTATPSSYAIRASTIDTLVFISSRNYISINNIAFEGANAVAIYTINSSNINIQNCDISNAGQSGIVTQNTSNVLVENCTTNNVLSNGMYFNNLKVSNTAVRNCILKNTGTLAGMGLNSGHSYKGIIAYALNNLVVEYNRVDTVGYVGIEFQGGNVRVSNNSVNHYCYVKDDGGGIYTWSAGTDANPGTIYSNRIVRDNVITNGIGSPTDPTTTSGGIFVSGIHLDGRAVNVDVLNNSVYKAGKSGLHCNNPVNVNIKGNTFFDNKNALSVMRWATTGEMRNLSIKNNICYPRDEVQRTFYYTNSALNEPVVTDFQSAVQAIGDIDSNYYSTINQTPFKFEYYLTTGGPGVPASSQSFEGWRAFSRHDSNAKKPFREPPLYNLRSLTSANLFSNGAFTSNILGLTLFGSNVTAVWDNTSKITGAGSLRMNFTAAVANRFGMLHSAIGPVSSAKKYILRVSIFGTTPYGIINAYLRKSASPYTSLVPLQKRIFGMGRTDFEFLFEAPIDEPASGSFVIEIEQNSGTTYLDNIELYEADASLYEMDDFLRFEYNPTAVVKTVSLGANYVGVDATYYPGTITLQPYTSKILVKDTSVLRLALNAKLSATSINCFGGNSAVTVSATGGIPPYTGTGVFTVSAGTYSYTVRDFTGAAATASITVTQPPAALMATATAGTISIFGGTTTVAVSATGGTAPYTGTGTFLNIIAGTYNYTVTDAKGCTATTTITVTQPSAALKATAAAAVINCFGGTTTVTVNATGGVIPYTGTGTFVVGAGTYNYTVRDLLGATNTVSITVTQPSAALVAKAVAGSISTFGGTTSVSITASGGTAPYDGTRTVSNVGAGTYSYIVTDSKGCSSTATVTISQPSATVSVVAGTPVINCFGGSSSTNVTASGGTPPYTGTGNYAVSAGKASVKISFVSTASGNNTALYYTIGALSSAKNYILRFSTLSTSATGSLRASVRQTYSPWSLLTPWQSGTFGTARKDHEFVFTAPTANAAASFIIDIYPNSGVTYVDNIAFFEADSNNNLKGANLYNYGDFESGINNILINNINGPTIASLDTSSKIPAVHYFTVRDANNLTATAIVKTSQPDQLQVNPVPGVISVFGGTTSVNITALGGTAPYTGTGTINNVAAGTYTYTVTDSKGCSGSATITVAQPLIPVTTSAKINCFGKTTNASVTASGGKAPYTGAGTYTVDAGKGSLRVSFPSSIAGAYTSVYYTIGAVSASKNYILRFSTFGSLAVANLRVGLRQTSSPWTMLTTRQTVTFGTGRKDHEFVFAAPTTEAAASFVIDINQNSGVTYIDNIAFFEAGTSNSLKGPNLYSAGNLESGISNLLIVSGNSNHVAVWDTTSKIGNIYYYVVTDAAGTAVTSVVNTTQPAAALQTNVTAGTITTTGGSTTVTVTATGGTAPYTGTGTFSNVRVGTYTYNVTDANGCAAAKTITVTQSAARQAVRTASNSYNDNIGPLAKAFTVTAYPNPATSNFGLKIEGGTNERVQMVVTTTDGKQVYSASGNSNQQYYFGAGFSTGLYVLKVTQGDTVKTLKLIKIK